MRTLVLSPPDARRWALESLLRNAGYEVEHFEDPAAAAEAWAGGALRLVIIDEPGEGEVLAAPFLSAAPEAGEAPPPVLCLTALGSVLLETLGELGGRVHLVPTPVDGLMLRMIFEDLGLSWGRVPANRPALAPPVPDRPWGRRGMREGTVDAEGNAVPVPAEPAGDAAPSER